MKRILTILLAAALLCPAAACKKNEQNDKPIADIAGNPTVTLAGDPVPGTGNGAAEGNPERADWEAWAQLPDFDYSALDFSKYIEVGPYQGLTVTKMSDVLTDEEFEDEIDAMLDNYSYYEEITEGAVSEGDRLRVDYAGYKDGVAFAGGTGTDQEVVASSGTGYIEGFAEAYIGKTVGEEFSFDVTFPENYGADDLNGQTVTFVTTVHAILTDNLITPVLDDGFVSSNFSYSNVEEFRIAYRETVAKQKAYYVNSQMYTDLWQQVLEHCAVKEYPADAVHKLYAEQRGYYESYASYYGTDYETFLTNYMAKTDDEIYATAEAYVKEDLVMYSLVKELGVEPTEEEYAAGIAFYAEYNGMTEDEILDYYGEDKLRTSVLWQALMEKIAEDAKIIQQ